MERKKSKEYELATERLKENVTAKQEGKKQ